MAAYDRSTILPCQLEPTSTVANGESDTTNSYYSSDSDSSAAMRQPRTSLTYAQATPIGASGHSMVLTFRVHYITNKIPAILGRYPLPRFFCRLSIVPLDMDNGTFNSSHTDVVEKVNLLVPASQHGGTSVAEGSP